MIAENKTTQASVAAKSGLKVKVASVAALLLLLAAGAVAGQKIYAGYRYLKSVSNMIDTDLFYPGIVVQGVDLGGKSMSEAKSAVEAVLSDSVPSVKIRVFHENQEWQITEKDLNLQYNTDEVLQEAYAYARSGDREERYRKVLALQTNPKNYSVTWKVDETALKSAVDTIANQADTAPKGPSVTAFNTDTKQFSFADGVSGISVDRTKLLTDMQSVLDSGGMGEIQLPVKEIPFEGTLEDLKSHMKKLGSFSTVSKNSENGTYNMTRALLSANGVRVDPGETFSFFGTVGECGKAQGYKPAGAILNGKLVQDYGGGICQASTTIYGAAIRSGMEITERHNHSIPSSYCRIGQDATVSYPYLDFKFTNPTDYPVFLVTSVKNRVLTVTFYGYQPDDYDSIDVISQVTETIAAPSQPQYTLDPSLGQGVIRLDAKARNGYRVKTQRIFRKNGTVVKTQDLPASYYRPSPAYYSYGEGTNLPENSSGPDSNTSSSQSSASSSQASSNPSEETSSSVSSQPVTSSLPQSAPDTSSSPISSNPEEDTPSSTSSQPGTSSLPQSSPDAANTSAAPEQSNAA
ncbi:MAG: hypothetical protein ACFWUC_03225 [Oscillospiraceae bacterium]|jgi:vancomycin resistance protein YoaR